MCELLLNKTLNWCHLNKFLPQICGNLEDLYLKLIEFGMTVLPSYSDMIILPNAFSELLPPTPSLHTSRPAYHYLVHESLNPEPAGYLTICQNVAPCYIWNIKLLIPNVIRILTANFKLKIGIIYCRNA